MRDPTSDGELLERARGGEQAAFRQLVERHEEAVSLTIAGMLGSSSDVDDVVQDVFIRFYQALDTFREESQVSTYLTRIAINRSIDVLRRRKRIRRRFVGTDDAPEPAGEEAGSVESRERRQQVHRAVAALPEKYRSVVVLRMIREFSTDETARILDVPYGTVLSRLSRAYGKLREMLEEE